MTKIEKGFINERLGLELDIYSDGVNEWFLAKDVSDYLGYIKPSDMTRIISFEENLATHNMRIGNTNTNVLMINEFGLNEILCKITKADTERWNKAREFQRWVFGTVLPELRKHGGILDITETDDIITTLRKCSTIMETAAKRYKELTDKLFIANKEVEAGINSDYDKSVEIAKLKSEIERIKLATKEFIQYKVTEYCHTHGVVEPDNLRDFAKLAREVVDESIPIADYIID